VGGAHKYTDNVTPELKSKLERILVMLAALTNIVETLTSKRDIAHK
jgi:hypothetical protein